MGTRGCDLIVKLDKMLQMQQVLCVWQQEWQLSRLTTRKQIQHPESPGNQRKGRYKLIPKLSFRMPQMRKRGAKGQVSPTATTGSESRRVAPDPGRREEAPGSGDACVKEHRGASPVVAWDS